jgi:AAA domain (dynein-related subfamily)
MTEVNIAKAARLLSYYMKQNEPVFLWGAPGIGKTDVSNQESAADKRPVIELRTNLREPVDFRGVPVTDIKTCTTRWFTPDELPRADRDGPRGTLFLDEMNTASAQVMAVCMGLVLERKIGEYRLPDGWTIIAAGNRVRDRAAAQRMPTALRNRFAHIDICVDVDAWTTWAVANNVAPEIIAFVRFRREFIHVMPNGDENAFPTPRSLTKCSKYVGAPDDLRLDLFAGLIGDGVAGELEGFIRLYRSLGSLDDIIANPESADIPSEPSARYAVCTGIARMATRKNFPAVVKYAERLPREFQILAVTDATRRDENLKNIAAYGNWAVKNQDVLIQ